MRRFILLSAIVLAGCTAADPAPPVSPDVLALRAVTMAGPSLSWQELRIHPELQRRACAVTTLVNVNHQVVGYCSGGQQCRTNDWRPVEAGCVRPPAGAPAPTTTQAPPPERAPVAGATAAAVDVAGMR